MHPLERQIFKKITSDHLIRDDEGIVVVGISGGADSVALLHLLLSLQTELGISLIAAHVNHGLRIGEADDDERFVTSLCKKLSVKCETVRVNVQEWAAQEKLSIEHAARELRYKALREVKKKHKAAIIAVAHTADDQAEELLIRLLRGSGRKGLSGMQSRSGDIIRPLLSIIKDTLLSYLKDKDITFCVDSSNSDMRFLRNRVRHRLIPYLEEHFDQGIRSALCKTADSLAEDEKLLEQLVEQSLETVLMTKDDGGTGHTPTLKLDRGKFRELPIALQRRIIERLLWQLQSRATFSHIMEVVKAAQKGTTGTEIHLSRGLRVGVQKEYLEFLYPKGFASWRGRLYK